MALGEHDPDWLDFYDGPPGWVADIRRRPPALPQIKDAAAALIVQLQANPEHLPAARVDFLVKQLKAIEVRVDLLSGIRRGFDEEADAFFGIRVPPFEDAQRLSAVRAEIARLLPGSGPLERRYAAFDEKFLIPPDRLPAVMDRAIEACRARTLRHLPLPAGEKISVEYVSDKPWSAYSYYQGGFRSRIEINTDFPLTVDRALQLACHETYPGHHAYNSLAESRLVIDKRLPEFTVQPAFSPQSFLSESMASVAAEVAFPAPDRLAFERDQLFPPAGLNPKEAEHYLRVEALVDQLEIAQVPIARRYLDGQLDFVRAETALEDQALMAHSDVTLKYLNEFRTYMLCYTEGRRRLQACLRSPDPWARYRDLIASQPYR
ncbi:MAG TPA: hypothetical protein VMB03_13120 [Bryobacteraceae bacterium]|nr:hypothetical protein [Bryobacteraceae bacterium]